jgi:hypothetical protein
MKKAIAAFICTFILFTSQKVFSQDTIFCDSVLQTSTCAGGNVIVPFHIVGNFPFGNVFTAQFSDWLGGFNNPVNIGTTFFTIGGNGIIFATIPANANFSFFYRIRVISSNPQDTSNTSPNSVIITQIAQLNSIISNPGDSACPGDTITLYALNIANSYAWSTGDTTQAIQVTTSGIYSVTTTDALTCQSTTSDTVYIGLAACTGIDETDLAHALNIFPNPASDEVHVEMNSSFGDDASITVEDCLGKILMKKKLLASQVIDVSQLSPGIYFFTIEANGERGVKKVMVQ